MVEEEVIKCISSILDNGVFFIEELRSEILKVRQYLEQLCLSLETMEEFLSSHDKHFMVENGRVTVNNSQLESGREKAVEFFEEELQKEMEKYGERPQCLNFRGHIGQADRPVIDYMNTFYPEEEFTDFLLEYPDVFVVFDDDTVNLIETESANFFRKYLENGGITVENLRYYTLSAPNYIKNFINTYYAGDAFLEFLENNSAVFCVEDDYVYMN